MRILFLTQVLPYPLDAGPKARAYYVLQHLSRGHQITLLSFARPADPPGAIEHLRTVCEAVHTVPIHRSRARDARHLVRSLTTDMPFLIARDEVSEMARVARALVEPAHADHPQPATESFDAIHADQLWMAPYALQARSSAISGPRPRLVLDQHNAVFQIPQRLARYERNPMRRALLELEGHKLARYEARVSQQFDHVVWVTDVDRMTLSAHLAKARRPTSNDQPCPASGGPSTSVIPICVDPERQRVIGRRPDAHRITFLGGLHWPPNAVGMIWFSRDIWPSVQRQVPGAMLTIIGKDPSRALSTASRSTMGVELTGYIPDPTPYLAETAVFIVPLQAGGGMRVKILDAWCWGLPVVSTRVGAEGIRVRDGENVLLADTARAFAEAVVRVLREPGLSARLAAGGRRTAEAHYDWRKVYPAWDRVYPRVEISRRGQDVT
jgi:glycosyltransferase involved in cell wall biosynthesis